MKEVNDVYSDLMTTPQETPVIVEDIKDQTVPTIEKPTSSSEPLDDKVNVSGSEDIKTEAKPQASEPEDVSWDEYIEDKSEPKTQEAKPSFDWSEVGKAVNLPDIKGQEDLVKYIGDLKKNVEDLKGKTISEDVPKALVEAIEIARQGGDYLSYLDIADVDYSAENPVTLFEEEVAELFYNQDGSFREEEYHEYIDSLTPTDKLMRGRQLQREMIMVQEQQKSQIKAKAAAEKAENLRKLESALNGFNKVDSFDVTPKVKKQLFNELATGEFLSQLGISENGNHNWEKLLNTYFKARYFDTIQKFNTEKGITARKRAELNELSNSTVAKTSKIENPVNTGKRTGFDLYMEQIK